MTWPKKLGAFTGPEWVASDWAHMGPQTQTFGLSRSSCHIHAQRGKIKNWKRPISRTERYSQLWKRCSIRGHIMRLQRFRTHSWAKIGSPLRISLAIEVTPIDALAQRLGGLPDLQILRSCLLCANFANKAIIILVILAPCSNHINHILVICVAVPTFALNWVSRSISQG